MIITQISRFGNEAATYNLPDDKQDVLLDFTILISVYALKKALTEDSEFRDLFTLKKQGKATTEQAARLEQKMKENINQANCASNNDGDENLSVDDVVKELSEENETYKKLDKDQNFYKQWLPQEGLGLIELAEKVSKKIEALKKASILKDADILADGYKACKKP